MGRHVLSQALLIVCLATPSWCSSVRRHSHRHHLSHRQAVGDVQPLIFIYELPSIFNTGLQQYYPLHDYVRDSVYDSDRELHEFLMTHPARTLDPCKADLFFLPVYTSWMVQTYWYGRFAMSNLNFDVWDRELHCERGICDYTNQALRAAIAAVRHGFPFWDEADGANHLVVFPTDHGICDGMVLLLHNGSAGQLMGASPQGEWGAPWQDAGWTGPPEEHTWCHRRGRDVVIPPLVCNGTDQPLVHPLAGERPIAVLLRFTDTIDTYGGLRSALLRGFDAAVGTFNGRLEFGNAPVEQTLDEMRRAVFCVSPPGKSAWTARLFRALVNGCIPVTMFEETELPYEDGLGLDWATFSVNFSFDVAVNRTEEVVARLQALLNAPEELRKMQEALGRAQRMYKWDRSDPHGAQASSVKAFQARAAKLAHIRKARKGQCDATKQAAAFSRWARAIDHRFETFTPHLPKGTANQLFEAVLPDLAYPLWPEAPWNNPESATGYWDSRWAVRGPWASPWAIPIANTTRVTKWVLG